MDALTRLLFGAGRACPDAVAVMTPAGRPAWTYADLDAASARLARALAWVGDGIGGEDVGVGDRVVVVAEKSPEVLALHLACVRAGVVFVPLSTAYPPAELAGLFQDAEPALVVADPCVVVPPGAGYRVVTLDADGGGSLIDAAAQGAGGLTDASVLHQNLDAGDAQHLSDDDPAAMLYTSGTTGRPKGVVLSRGNLAVNAETLARAWGFRPGDVLVHVLPLSHTHGLFVAAHATLVAGASMLLLPRFDAAQVVVALPRATVLMGVPTHYTRLLEHPGFDRAATAGMRLLTSGSAPMARQTHMAVRERTGHTVLERYGMTETSILTANPLDGERRIGTVGPPLPGVGLRVVDDGDAVLAAGEVGGVQVRGPNVFAGYWRRPELREVEFTPDGWFRTGDLGRLDADGYLEIIDRDKDLVITGGLNVYPKQVEQALLDLDAVADCAVVGLPDADLGERVVAVVVGEPGARLDPDSLRAALRDRLAGYKVPKQVFVAEALPRNTMGKIEKARLRDSLLGQIR